MLWEGKVTAKAKEEREDNSRQGFTVQRPRDDGVNARPLRRHRRAIAPSSCGHGPWNVWMVRVNFIGWYRT